MKTTLLTLGLTGAFFAVGVLALQGQLPGVPPIPGTDAAAVADSLAAAVALAAPPPEAAEVAALAAELAEVQARLGEAEARADSLRAVIGDRHVAADADEEASAEAVAALATTLTKLEEAALGEVVQRLDGRSFVRLYQATTARNRTRLLDALTPTQAAAFIRNQLPGGAPVHAAADRGAGRGPASNGARDSTSTSP